MESTVLVDSEIKRELDRFVAARLYTDGDEKIAAPNRAFQLDSFGNVALPFFAFYDSEGNLARSHQGTATKEQFLAWLKAIK